MCNLVKSTLRVSVIFLLVFLITNYAYGQLGPQADLATMDLASEYDYATDSVVLEWYPAFPDAADGYVINCYDTRGTLALSLKRPLQDRSCVIERITEMGLQYAEVLSLDSSNTELERSPREELLPPATAMAPPSVMKLSVASFGAMAAGSLDISLVSCNSQNFPFIYLTVRVNQDGQPIADLTRDNFSITEDSIAQTDSFDVTPPGTSGGVRMADIVFLIDTSGSMGGEIAAVRNNCVAFVV